jgi:hypothetical protein
MRGGFFLDFSAALKKRKGSCPLFTNLLLFKCKGNDAADTAEPREESLKEQVELSGKYPS